LLGLTLGAAALAFPLNLWHWRINLPTASLQEWQSIGRLFLWFTWPAWPLALWTLWRWRRQIFNTQLSGLHLWLPICFVAGASVATLTTAAADRSLLLALPALAALAAFALPTLSRSVSALIDWFTLIFFSGCVLIIWVVWLAVQTGFPSQPAANVARLLPGFTTQFSLTALLIAVTASLSWAWLVGWRVGQHRAALWKSVVLPAGGAALSWLLLLTLWLPMLDFARSYAPMVQQVQAIIGSSQPACVAEANLSRSQIAALQFHGDWKIEALHPDSRCPWLIADLAWPNSQAASTHSMTDWEFRGFIAHPAERQTSLILYQRQIAAARSVPAVPGKQ
jgi:4-amino-4-deoxy-L-arabinose transferase-like glycosyltransferase